MDSNAKDNDNSNSNSNKDNTSSRVNVQRWEQGALLTATDEVADETAIALSFNGVSHAVMMATPADLEDFCVGFSLCEDIIETTDEIYAIDVQPAEHGIEVKLEIAAARFASLKQRRRNLTGRTGCGLCGAESLAQAIRPTAKVTAITPIEHAAIQRAREQIFSHQPLRELTGALHGAAACSRDGDIVMLREDVGRHNALDKLIGALARSEAEIENGFLMISSRISYEMVQKPSVAGFGLLAAVSAPTQLAIDLAEVAGIALVAFVRPDRHVIYTHAQFLGLSPGA